MITLKDKARPENPYRRVSVCFPWLCTLGRIFLVLSIFVMFSGCKHLRLFNNWDTKDTAMLTTSLGLTFIDYRMTSDLSKRRDEGYYEKYNSIGLGRHPSQGRINAWFLGSVLTKTLIAGVLPKNEKAWLGFGRESWLTLNIGISGGMVHRNFEIGLEVNF